MSIPSAAVGIALCAAVAAACSHAPPPAGAPPQPAAAPSSAAPGQANMSGDWAVQLTQQGSPVSGMLRLVPAGDGFTGNLQLDGVSQPYFVRSVQVQGEHVVMILGTPDGDARIEGNLRAPTQFEGILTSRGLNGRFTASRR